MKSLFTLLALSFLVLTSSAYAEDDGEENAGKPSDNPRALAINQACAGDAQTAGCGNAQVGTGLLKCLRAYKKAHRKEFKFSDGCKGAMKEARAERKEKRGKNTKNKAD